VKQETPSTGLSTQLWVENGVVLVGLSDGCEAEGRKIEDS
jgi:hypothetical protein